MSLIHSGCQCYSVGRSKGQSQSKLHSRVNNLFALHKSKKVIVNIFTDQLYIMVQLQQLINWLNSWSKENYLTTILIIKWLFQSCFAQWCQTFCFSNVRICCFSLSSVVVNGLFFLDNKLSKWAKYHFGLWKNVMSILYYFLTIYRISDLGESTWEI